MLWVVEERYVPGESLLRREETNIGFLAHGLAGARMDTDARKRTDGQADAKFGTNRDPIEQI